jgi:von Willebrand factor type A C-terminal domain/von Willebrand factor type A domain
MGFKVEAFQNRYLAPGTNRVDAIVSVTADPSLKASGDLVVGFIIDKSGSMAGSRIHSVIGAVTQAISMLDERSYFFVVVFDGAAYVAVPETRATQDSKQRAAESLQQIQAQGGTAMSTGLREARAIFARAPNAIHQAIFLTDGKNEGERGNEVAQELARCEGGFECDCWGVGTDWQVGEVQQISEKLLGKAALVPDPAGVAAAFRGAIEKASGKALKDVRLRIWTPQGAELAFVKQVNPTIDDMTARAKVVSPQIREYLTGSWGGGEVRDFHVAIDVKPGKVGDEMLAGRPSLAYLVPSGGSWTEQEEKPPEARLFASWTADDSLTSRLDHHVAHYTGQDELAEAIQKGLEMREQGNEGGATQLLGKAVKIAHASGNAEMTQRLGKVVEVMDAASGTVRLKKDVKKAATMDLQLESRTTKRVAKRAPAGGT